MADEMREAQEYQSIGEPSPELAGLDVKGWQGTAAEPLADQITGHDTSFWNRRANRQAQGTNGDPNYAQAFFDPTAGAGVPSEAGHTEDDRPVVGYANGPITPYGGADAGTIDGADAAAENPANPPY